MLRETDFCKKLEGIKVAVAVVAAMLVAARVVVAGCSGGFGGTTDGGDGSSGKKENIDFQCQKKLFSWRLRRHY